MVGSFSLPPLPFDSAALAPHISQETINFHYGKHHAGYVNKLNAIAETDKLVASSTLEELIISRKEGKVFNLAAQVWNHSFYWQSLSPHGGGEPSGRLLDLIRRDFGSFEKFQSTFDDVALSHFGSGWAWLVLTPKNKLKVVGTHDAGNPLTDGLKPLITCDVWEHAYYIDYRNARADYLKAFWSLVNWNHAESLLIKGRL